MIYHIATEKDWNHWLSRPEYAPEAFEREGFVHTSHRHQLGGVVERYYAGRTDLILLHIDEQKLACQLVEEPSTNGELFPHIYGKINKSAIVKVENPWSFR